MGMTNEQYKGILIDQREAWQDVLKKADEGKIEEIKEKAKKQLDNISEKMNF